MQTNTDFIKEQSRCIAHEIRNQISIVDVYTEIIKKNLQKNGIDNSSINNALNCIHKSAQMVNNSLLDLKSLNNFEPKEVDLHSIVLESVEMAKVYIHDKNIKINTVLNDTTTVLIDENKFLACLINIIKNAIEAIDEVGTINITVDLFKDFASIKISNNGLKIPDEKQAVIFTEGFTTKSSGSGLGLYICKNNLKSLGADLKLNRSDSEMTEFEINISIKNC